MREEVEGCGKGRKRELLMEKENGEREGMERLEM